MLKIQKPAPKSRKKLPPKKRDERLIFPNKSKINFGKSPLRNFERRSGSNIFLINFFTMAKIIELILTDEKTGRGTEGDPVRRKPQLFTKDGRLVAECDEHANRILFAPENLENLN